MTSSTSGSATPTCPRPTPRSRSSPRPPTTPSNHRYSASRGIPKLRQAISSLYLRRFGVELDPDTEVVTTIGAKEGLSHLMWVLLGPGDSALVPSPSYPIHIYAPALRRRRGPPGPPGAGHQHRRARPRSEAFFDNLMESWESAWPKPRVIVLSFPHNPTTACVDLAWMQRIVDFAREHEIVLVHDFAYADIAFDGYQPPSILQVPGAKDVAVELYSLTKSFSMAGWRVAFMVGNPEIVAALTKLKSYLDYGTFQPIQIAAIVAMNEVPDYPEVGQRDLPGPARRPVRRAEPHRVEPHARPRGRCSCGRPSPSPTARWGRSSSPPSWCPRPRWPPRPGSGSGPAATATSGSRSSRTSSASARPFATCAARSPSCTDPGCTSARDYRVSGSASEGGHEGVGVLEAERELAQL